MPEDPKDTPEMLREYLDLHKPAYEMLIGLERSDVEVVLARVLEEMGQEGLPASVLTDQDGRILLTRFGAPTVSKLRKLLHH